MVYKIIKNKNNIRILGKNFVEKNKTKGSIIYNEKKFPLQEEIEITDIDKDKLIIGIEIGKNLLDLTSMFEDCEAVLEFNNYNYFINNVNDINDNESTISTEKNSIFSECKNNQNESFYENLLPSIVKETNELNSDNLSIINETNNLVFHQNKFTNFNKMFYKCFSLISITANISQWNTENVNIKIFFYELIFSQLYFWELK